MNFNSKINGEITTQIFEAVNQQQQQKSPMERTY
jgi:hypothetical protein